MAKKVKKDENLEIEKLREQLVRALADYDNLQKRVARERENLNLELTKNLVVRFLPIYDMILAAQEHLDDKGIALILAAFEEVLAGEGIEMIRPKVGDSFNPDFCEAVEVVESKRSEDCGKIAEVVLSGWKFKSGPVLRHSKVKVFGQSQTSN